MNIEERLNRIEEKLGIASSEETPEFKEGDWVVCDDSDPTYMWLFGTKKGFNWVGHWSNNLNIVKGSTPDRKATFEEIKEALVREAKRRYEGKVVQCLYCPYDKATFKASILEYTYNLDELSLSTEDDVLVYEKGEWAEVVEEKKTLLGHEVEKLLIGAPSTDGYDLIIQGYKIGFAEFKESELDTFIEVAEVLAIEEFIAETDRGSFTLKELKEALA